MAIKGLDRFMGESIEGTFEKALSQKENPKKESPQNPAPNLNGFIYVPSINLYVAKERTLQGKNWNDAHTELKSQGNSMLTIPEFWEFREYLINQHQDKNEAGRILDDIFKIGNWRGEWLDAYFEKRKDGMYVITQNKTKPEKLKSYLHEDTYADIVFDKQGLLTSKSSNQNYSQGNNVYFYHPRDGAVAGFVAYSGRAGLYCGWDPSNSGPALGVHASRAKI